MSGKLRYRLAAALGLTYGKLASPSTRLLVAGIWIVASMAATFAYFVEATREPDRRLGVNKENVE